MEFTRTSCHGDSAGAAVASCDVGAIVRHLRRANHLTLAQLAARCGYSVSTLSRMERGKQPLRDVRVLRTLADALGVAPKVLGLADTPQRSTATRVLGAMVGDTLGPAAETDPMRRRTLLAGLTGVASAAVLGAPRATAGEPIAGIVHALVSPDLIEGGTTDLGHLRHQVSVAYAAFQQGRYADLAARLPGLIASAHATRDNQRASDSLEAANGQLADVYTLASQLAIRLGHDHLAWTTADRAQQAAQLSNDILTQAAARRAWGIVLRRSGHADTAQQLVTESAAALQPHLTRGPEHLSVYGSLLATAAYTAAVDGHRPNAQALLAEATDAARQLGTDANHRHTAFGPTGVALYQISIARVLGDSGTAIETARRIRPDTIPVPERRARYWTDVARSFHQWGKPEHCYRALLAAERAAPDEVRYRKPIQ